ncbi:hypothetical protein POM88_016432 [Heracleum sosnowskyi]|uniref:Uncharacterized protein n=1 Tax=Heracleum sosnowskyi TaxID=360622 RepID=A0AAD8ILQ1_9APIA|nr:hypothetical protein POM88_016432 [Heracleum sosnowskyi]
MFEFWGEFSILEEETCYGSKGFHLLNPKIFNERMVIYLLAAIFALCSGSSLHCDRDFFLDPLAEDLDQAIFYELYACAPEVLAKINISSGSKVGQLQPDQSVRLPRQISDLLLYEMEDCILEAFTCDKDKYRRVTIYCSLPFIITLMHLALNSEKMELDPQSTAQEVIHGILHRREFSLGMMHIVSGIWFLISFQRLALEIHTVLFSTFLGSLAVYMFLDNSIMTPLVLRGHSKGVNLELVQNSLLELERKFEAEEISVEKSDIWKTHGKSFETWICSLAYALIGYCDDIILRLCQEIVLQKAEVAEILFPNVMVNLAGRKNLDFDLCKLISSKVLENIFVKSNMMVKSIQVMLSALNEVRLCHVMERTSSSVLSSKQESSKGIDKPSSYNSRSRLSVKLKDSASTSTELVISSLLWEKVYWLAIDYLVVAKSAISCGSYFTAVFLYGTVQSSKLSSQIITFEHDGNWSKALKYYDLQDEMRIRKPYKGLIRSLQQLGCTHVLDLYSQGLTSRKGRFQHGFVYTELQYEAAWRTGNWDFSLLYDGALCGNPSPQIRSDHFNENLHGCLLQEGDVKDFYLKLKDSKQELLFSIYHASEESTEYL